MPNEQIATNEEWQPSGNPWLLLIQTLYLEQVWF